MPIPSRQEMIEDIRRAAIACNPEIVELKFGCFYRVNGKPSKDPYCVISDHMIQTIKNMDLIIIGRKLGLADILLILDVQAIVCASDGQFGELEAEEAPSRYGIFWNLRKDDLNLQEDSTILFIHGLVK